MIRGIFVLVSALILANCEEAEELADCQEVCQSQKDCVDDNFDVGACRSDCEDRSDNDRAYRDEIAACEACIDDRACAEQAVCLQTCPINI